MKIKLLLDEDVQVAVAHALRQRGYDVYHAQELSKPKRQFRSRTASVFDKTGKMPV